LLFGLPGDLQEAAAEEEHQPGIDRVAELAIHRKPEQVPIEPARTIQLDRAQQDTAGEYVHNSDDAAASDRARCTQPCRNAAPRALARMVDTRGSPRAVDQVSFTGRGPGQAR